MLSFWWLVAGGYVVVTVVGVMAAVGLCRAAAAGDKSMELNRRQFASEISQQARHMVGQATWPPAGTRRELSTHPRPRAAGTPGLGRRPLPRVLR